MKITREQLLESLTLDLRWKKQSWKSYVPFAIAFTWALLLFLSPLLLPPGTVYLGNDGKVSLLDNADYINKHVENPVVRAVYLSGDVMCHQHANRSFFINGNQMPYCARCTGIFLGLGIGAFIIGMFCVRIGFLLYFLSIVLLSLDGVTQLLTSYESNNFMRLLTGLLVGIFSAILFGYVYSYSPEEHAPR